MEGGKRSRALLDVYALGRSKQIEELYALIKDLKDQVGGYRYLSQSDGKISWPSKGVYFFFEQSETRQDKKDHRVVRVGTHALKSSSKSTLWGRLRQHKGTSSGIYAQGGNHRGSIFRLHVGASMLKKDGREEEFKIWGVGQSADTETRMKEHPIEACQRKNRSNALPLVRCR